MHNRCASMAEERVGKPGSTTATVSKESTVTGSLNSNIFATPNALIQSAQSFVQHDFSPLKESRRPAHHIAFRSLQVERRPIETQSHNKPRMLSDQVNSQKGPNRHV